MQLIKVGMAVLGLAAAVTALPNGPCDDCANLGVCIYENRQSNVTVGCDCMLGFLGETCDTAPILDFGTPSRRAFTLLVF